MLLLIDAALGLWIDDSMVMMMGEEGLESSFILSRLNENVKKGTTFDASFRKGKKSLLLYPSGQSVITHISASKIEKLMITKSDRIRQLEIELHVMKLRMANLEKKRE